MVVFRTFILLVSVVLCAPPSAFSGQGGLAADQEDLALFFDEQELLVESASRITERVSEAPAVVNVITAREIRRLGARNLMDVLATIPGFTEIQDTNEKVVAGRGVFATTTHKILLLRDGHRLNEPMFEEMMPADAISLDSIRRIEVLRGTGASLYGNAALLAVVNIVTLRAEDGGARAALGVGNFRHVGGDVVLNERLPDGRQMLFFAHASDHRGESVQLSAGQDRATAPLAGSQRVEGRPFNFDVGMKFRGDRSQLEISARRAAYNTPRANNGALLTAQDNLVTPVQVFDFQHLDLLFQPRWHGAELTLRHYADRSFLRSPQYTAVARDAPPAGKAFDLRIETVRAGVEYSARWEHARGTLIVGTQMENFWLLDSAIVTSFADQKTMVASPSLAKVSEWNGALYMQEKYHVSDRVVLNAGVRWSRYKAFGNALDPRVAVVFHPVGRLHVKLIYGRAFQAPSYFYRAENKGLGYGAPNGLSPERLDNYQISVENGLDAAWMRMSIFHNRVSGLITRPSGSSTYQNLRQLTTRGVESELKFRPFSMLELFANHTVMWAVAPKSDAKLLSGGRLANIPRNAVTGGVIWGSDGGRCSGSLYTNWHGPIPSPIGGSANTIPSAAVVHATLRVSRLPYGVDARFSIHNLLDKRDWRGGTTAIPYPQQGRSFLLTLGLSL